MHVIPINDPHLRRAVYEAFHGRCFYTGRDVAYTEMHIDHVRPKSKGGEDSVYNYVLACKDINLVKNNVWDEGEYKGTLALIATRYAPNVMKYYKQFSRQNNKRNKGKSNRRRSKTQDLCRQNRFYYELRDNTFVTWEGKFIAHEEILHWVCFLTEATLRNVSSVDFLVVGYRYKITLEFLLEVMGIVLESGSGWGGNFAIHLEGSKVNPYINMGGFGHKQILPKLLYATSGLGCIREYDSYTCLLDCIPVKTCGILLNPISVKYDCVRGRSTR